MSFWMQNIIVLLAVAICLIVLIRQAMGTLAGRKTRLGSCCAKGCGAGTASAPPTSVPMVIPSRTSAIKESASGSIATATRTIFIPSDMVIIARRK